MTLRLLTDGRFHDLLTSALTGSAGKVRHRVNRTHFSRPKAAGIEPASCAESTLNGDCACVKCQHPCAAEALHSGGLNCHFLASLDADLQRVIAAWDALPTAIRMAIGILLVCGK